MPLPTPTLHTDRLRLRPFDDADADTLFALHGNAYVLRYWDAPPWSERLRAERFIAACRQMAAEGSGARLAMNRVSDGAFIGWCSLTRWNPDYRSASMGYCLDDAAWGHGYATEAARALLQWAFDTLDLNRVQAETDTRNGASARVLEKLGFVREGTLREDCVVNGEVSDSWVYGLVRREWRPSSEPPPYIGTMGSRCKHISIDIDRSTSEVYDFAADPLNLPTWAAGLASSTVEGDGQQWFTESPMGRVTFTFAPRNDFGVLDHDVTLPSGQVVHNPLRVIGDGDACEVVFTLRRRPDMTDEDFARDADAVAKDLTTLKSVVEAR